MSETSLTLVFDGPAVENGEIDVRDFAPALLAMGDLIQVANEEINGNRAQIAVKVTATSKGSFEVDLTLMQSLIENTKALFDFAAENKDRIAAASDLADILFKVAGGATVTAGGLFALIKFLRGRKPDRIKQKAGDVHVQIGDQYFVTNARALQLASSVKVREQAKKAIATLSNEGIDTIRVRRPKEKDLEINKSSVGYFEYEDTEEELADEQRHMTLQIISLSFKEDNKWRVTDGGDPFSVTIEDTAFLDKISHNEVAFRKGDYLVCTVRERQFRSATGLRKERCIINVLEHKNAAQQLRLV